METLPLQVRHENSYDASSTTAFSVMLGNLGYKVTPDAYTNSSDWTSLVTNINSELPGTVDAVHLQAYSGGAGNDPCSGWDFGDVPVYPGLWDQDDTPAEVKTTMAGWHTTCGTAGGFLWLYDDIAGKSEASKYASSFKKGIAATTALDLP